MHMERLSFSSFSDYSFSEAKRKYPAIADVPDIRLLSLRDAIQGNPDRKRVLLESKHSEVAPSRETYMEALDQWQLPEGWGDLMLSLTNPLIEGIPLGISSTMLATYAGDPYLTQLLKLVLIYALFTESDNERDATHVGAMMRAQDLNDLLTWMPRLRHGGTRFLQRLVRCIKSIINPEL